MSISLIQGDSYFEDFVVAEYPALDINWTGSWYIVPELGAPPVSSGSLVNSGEVMQLRIAPASTNIPVGDYRLVVEIKNGNLLFSKEVKQEKLKIKMQGIPTPL